MHNIQVRKGNRGYQVKVGCHRIYFGEDKIEKDEMCNWFAKYIQNPDQAAKDFHEQYPDQSMPEEAVAMDPVGFPSGDTAIVQIRAD